MWIKNIDFYCDILCRKAALCKHVSLPHSTQTWVMAVAIISGLMHVEFKHFLWLRLCVRTHKTTYEMDQMVANELSDVLFIVSLLLRKNYLKLLLEILCRVLFFI